jgi:hypothetical protein
MRDLTGYVLRRAAAWVRRRVWPPVPPAHEPEVIPYARWIERRLVDRRSEYPAVDRPGLFSLLTPVFNPPAGFFRILGNSILAQDHQDWQWVLIDNGCTHQDVLYLLDRFARDPRVTLVRAGTPRGIIGGMRLALEQARGEYVCPVDHDDRLYPDALRVAASCLQRQGWPKLAYSDEDKLLPDGQAGLPFPKPCWDPLLFLNCCYVAHLGILHRQTALELGVYTDPQAEGTPDGDAFCRFTAAGHMPVHIPEILYSWRMHPQSTALLGIEAKPYVTASQKHALGNQLHKLELSDKVNLRTNELLGKVGTWRIVAQETAATESLPVLVAPCGTRQLRTTLEQRLALTEGVRSIRNLRPRRSALLHALKTFPDDAWLVLINPYCLPLTTDFVREFQAVRHVVPEAGWVGGTTLRPDGRVLSAGLVWGFADILGSPLQGANPRQVAKGAGSLAFQRSVSAVEVGVSCVQAGLLRDALRHAEGDLADPLLPAWLGAAARERGQRVLYTPFVTGQYVQQPPPRKMPSEARHRFLTLYGHLLAADPYYARYYGLTPKRAFRIVHPRARARVLRKLLTDLADNHPHYHAWVGDEACYPAPPKYSFEATNERVTCSIDSQAVSLSCPEFRWTESEPENVSCRNWSD